MGGIGSPRALGNNLIGNSSFQDGLRLAEDFFGFQSFNRYYWRILRHPQIAPGPDKSLKRDPFGIYFVKKNIKDSHENVGH